MTLELFERVPVAARPAVEDEATRLLAFVAPDAETRDLQVVVA